MGRVGLTAFLEASAQEIKLAETQRWFWLALVASALALALLMLVLVALAWDTPHRLDVIVALALLACAACGGAWYVYWQYVKPRQAQHHQQEPLEAPPPPSQALGPHAAAAAPPPLLQREHAWLLLPAAVIALMYPRITLRLVAGVVSLWRASGNGASVTGPPPR